LIVGNLISQVISNFKKNRDKILKRILFALATAFRKIYTTLDLIFVLIISFDVDIDCKQQE
jgi:hypothetical protein